MLQKQVMALHNRELCGLSRFVIPAKAGVHIFTDVFMDSRLHGNDNYVHTSVYFPLPLAGEGKRRRRRVRGQSFIINPQPSAGVNDARSLNQ